MNLIRQIKELNKSNEVEEAMVPVLIDRLLQAVLLIILEDLTIDLVQIMPDLIVILGLKDKQNQFQVT